MKTTNLMDDDILIDTHHSKKELLELDNQTSMLLKAMKERRRSKNEMSTSETDDLDSAVA